MIKQILSAATFTLLVIVTHAQQNQSKPTDGPQWTESDRKYLIDNLTRTRQAILEETDGLTNEQWGFKESPDRWNINQIVEHIAIWELLFMREITVALQREADPAFTYYPPDSAFMSLDPNGVKKNNAMEYTKPFSYAMPLGNNEGKDNVTWLMTMRNESIDYLTNETRNIRQHYSYSGANVHHIYMMIFNHTDRHLRQIRKVKEHAGFPK